MKRILNAVALMGTMAAMTCGLLAAESPAPSAPVPTTDPSRLTIERLGKMLDDMGYNPKPIKSKEDKLVGYSVEFKSEEWTMRFGVYPTADGSRIWFDGGLFTLTDLAGVQVPALLNLLEQNERISPAYVYYLKARSNVRLSMPFDNHELTAAKLRNQVEFFTMAIKLVVREYEKAAKPPQATPAGPAPIPSM